MKLMNGIFINSDGVPFAIVNGSMHEMEPNAELKLAPGYYDEYLRPVDDFMNVEEPEEDD
jgi:hypothetical protein